MGFSGSVRFRCVALRYSKISVSVLNCQVIECVDFFAKPSSKIQVKLYIIIYCIDIYFPHIQQPVHSTSICCSISLQLGDCYSSSLC